MNLSLFIAKRYFFSKNKVSSVNLVSRISQFAIAIGTAALILVLSVFNGFEKLVLDMYNVFDPHIKITSNIGKTFHQDYVVSELELNDGISVFSKTLEEKVLLKYNSKEYIATIKGVDSLYQAITNFDSIIVEGDYFSNSDKSNVAVVGRGVAYHLSLSLGSLFDQITVLLPNRKKNNLLSIENSFTQKNLIPIGVFGVQQEVDSEYLISPLPFVQDLLNKNEIVTSIDILLNDEKQAERIKFELQKKLGEDYKVQTRFEQHKFLYKIMNSEKLAVLLILLFILIISSFNIIGSLSMLITEKKSAIHLLQSVGMQNISIKSIFYYKGFLTVLSGTIIGLLFGLVFAFLQLKFGFITMGEGSFVISSYPVLIKALDVVFVFGTVIIVGCLSVIIPVRNINLIKG